MKKILLLFLCSQFFCLYSKDLYRIRYNNKFGYIDKNLTIVINPQYDYAENFIENYAIIANTKENNTFYSVINKNNKLPDEKLSNCARLFRVSKSIFYNSFDGYFYDITQHKNISLSKNSLPYFNNFSQDFLYPRNNFDSDSIEYIDINQNIKLSSNEWRKAFPMTDNIAFVIKKDWSQVIINNNGEEIIKNIYDCGINPSEGLLPVQTNAESGYINNKGDFIILCSFEPNLHVFSPPGLNYPFSEGVAAVQTRKGIFKIFDLQGNTIMDEKSLLDMKPCSNGLILYQTLDNKFGYFNKEGKSVFNTEFEYAESFNKEFALVNYKGKDAILDKKGNIFLSEDLVLGKKKSIINVLNH